VSVMRAKNRKSQRVNLDYLFTQCCNVDGPYSDTHKSSVLSELREDVAMAFEKANFVVEAVRRSPRKAGLVNSSMLRDARVYHALVLIPAWTALWQEFTDRLEELQRQGFVTSLPTKTPSPCEGSGLAEALDLCPLLNPAQAIDFRILINEILDFAGKLCEVEATLEQSTQVESLTQPKQQHEGIERHAR